MARRIRKSLLLMDKSYAVKRFKQVFREFQKLYPRLVEDLVMKERRVKTGMGSQPLLKLEELKTRGELVMTNVKSNLTAAQDVYEGLRTVMENPRKFKQAVYGGRVFEYIQMAENAHRGDGIKAQALFAQLTQTQIEGFFKSDYYVPFVVEADYEFTGSEEYRNYIQREGESPLITRLQDYVNEVANIAFDTSDQDITDEVVLVKARMTFQEQLDILNQYLGTPATQAQMRAAVKKKP